MPFRTAYRRKRTATRYAPRIAARSATRRTRRRNRRTRTGLVNKPMDFRKVGKCNGLIMFDKFYTNLRFINVDTPVLPTSLTAVTSKRYTLNGLWDPDPAIATTDVPGFTNLGRMWSQYRALRFNIKCNFMNLTTFPIYCMLYVHTQDDSFLPTTWADYMELRGNQNVAFGLMEQSGSNASTTLTMRKHFGDVIGNRQLYRSNLNYEGQTASDDVGGANPTKAIHLDVICLSYTSTGTFGGTTPFHLEIEWRVMFHDLAEMV